MDIIRPLVVDESRLVSSSVPEDDHPAWQADKTYAKGERCVSDHRIWQSAQDANKGNAPAMAAAGWWAEIGATNRWAMFDTRVGTQTRAEREIRIVLRPGRFDSVALLNVSAAHVEVVVRVDGEETYRRRVSMVDSTEVRSWYEYFFEPIRERRDLVLRDVPSASGAQVEVVLGRASGEVACGVLVVGMRAALGRVLRGAQVSIDDYSRVFDDGFGALTLVRGDWAKRAEVRLVLSSREVDRIQALLAEQRATPVVWVGCQRYQSLTIYGKYDSFVIDITYATVSFCTLTIRGLI